MREMVPLIKSRFSLFWKKAMQCCALQPFLILDWYFKTKLSYILEMFHNYLQIYWSLQLFACFMDMCNIC